MLKKISKQDRAAEKVKTVVYGLPGSGKTTFCAALQKTSLGGVVFMNINDGLGRVCPDGVLTTPKIENRSGLSRAYSFLLKEWPSECKTLVVDSITEILHMITIEKDVVGTFDAMTGLPKMSQYVYQKRNIAMRQVVHTLLKLPADNIIFIANELQDKADDGSVISVKPDVSNRLSTYVAGEMDNIVRINSTSSGGRVAVFSQTPKVMAKCRRHLAKGEKPFVNLPHPDDLPAAAEKIFLEKL